MLTDNEVEVLAEFFRQEDVEEAADIMQMIDDNNVNATRLLRKIFEETNFRKWLRRSVRRGRTSPDVYRELFGRGEGSGLPEADGVTIETVLDANHELQVRLNALLERKQD